MNQNLQEKIKSMFYRLVGMESAEERKALDEWLEDSPEGRRLLEEMSDGEAFAKRKRFINSLDVEEELQRVVISSRRKRFIKNIYWRAAVILFPFIIGGVAFYLIEEKNWQRDRDQIMDIRPGIRGAVLELSDGSLCELHESPQRINEKNGREIVKDSVLNYQAQISSKNHEIIYNRLKVKRGHEYMLILSDGTRVWLNSQSELHYPVTFNGKTRRVSLSGEAYFEVAKDTSSPFIVEVDQRFEVKVLGTSFNIKAYPTDHNYETTLVSGRVEVEQSDGLKVVLKPSEQLVIKENGGYVIREVDLHYYLAWHEGWFYFNDESLEQVLEMFGRWYDVDFKLSDDKLREIRVTGKVKRFESLSVILEMMTKIAGVDFQIEGKVVKVSKK